MIGCFGVGPVRVSSRPGPGFGLRPIGGAGGNVGTAPRFFMPWADPPEPSQRPSGHSPASAIAPRHFPRTTPASAARITTTACRTETLAIPTRNPQMPDPMDPYHRLAEVLGQERPEVCVVYGDVTSTLAAALAAAQHDVPVAHVEAGLRSHDLGMPEERNRLLTDRLSTWLFTPSQDANDNLAKEGVAPARIHLVGNVMIDTLRRLLPRMDSGAVRAGHPAPSGDGGRGTGAPRSAAGAGGDRGRLAGGLSRSPADPRPIGGNALDGCRAAPDGATRISRFPEAKIVCNSHIFEPH